MTTIDKMCIHCECGQLLKTVNRYNKHITSKKHKTQFKQLKDSQEKPNINNQKRTRNIQAYKRENEVFEYYKNKFPDEEIRKVNNKLFIKGNDNENPKADWMHGDKRIQFKKDKYVYIHNWTKTSHLEYIQRVYGINLLEDLERIVLSQEEELERKLRLKPRRKLKKVAVSVRIVEDDSKISDELKINNLRLKKIFIHWDRNENNNFYYIYGDDINNMIHMTDDIINGMKIVYDIRSIYSNSGKTNLGMENIFENNNQINEMIERINN